MSTYKNLMTVCCAAVLALGLAACGSSSDSDGPTAATGGGSGGGGTMELTPLQTANELVARFDDLDVAQHVADATKYAGMLNAEMVDGDSATAAANAQAVLDANMAVADAVDAADEALEEIEAARMAAEDIEDEDERAAVLALLDVAEDAANELKTQAQTALDVAATPGDNSIDSLADAVAAVENPGNADPAPHPAMTATDAGEAVAATVMTAIAAAAPGTNATLGNAPMGAIRNDSADIEAMNWEQIVIRLGGTVMDVRRFANNAVSEVKAASVDGRMVSDFLADGETAPAAQDHPDGEDFDSTRRGIDGTVFCAGTDCKVDADGVMTGSWYFTPDSTTELYVAGMGGTYSVATLYAQYGYWLTYTDGNATDVNLYAAKGHDDTNTDNLNLTRGADATSDVTARYSGRAVGISVRDKASGEFTANVNLTATFGATTGKLGGMINGFHGPATSPTWVVRLEETDLTAAAALDGGNGIAYGGAAAGVWTAQGYGPAQTPAADGNPAVDHRPEGFYGRFNANFNDGAAAGAYATRK